MKVECLPEQNNSVLIQPPASLESLPAETLLEILRYSVNPALIHVCRSLWLKLPAYVPFSRALAAMALYMEPHKFDQKLESLMDSYWRLRGVRPRSRAQLEEIRQLTVCSPWFSASKFEQVYNDIRSIFEQEEKALPMVKYPELSQVALDQQKRNQAICESLYLRLIRNVETYLLPKDDSDPLSVFHYPGLMSMRSNATTGLVQDFVIRTPVTEATARMIKYWIREYGLFRICDTDLLRQAITSAIMQNMPTVLTALLAVQRRLVYPTPQRSLTVEQVKLAAELCHVSVLKILLDQQIWFQVSRADLLAVAQDLKSRKPDGWKRAYELLMDDRGFGWTRADEGDLWAKLDTYAV